MGSIALFKRNRSLSSEEQDVILSLKEIRAGIKNVYEKLDYAADELITDSLNYELLSLQCRHRFFTAKAKEMKMKYL